MATIKDVAREAGVSIATVSNYINRRSNVSEKSAKKIAEAIRKLNYVLQSSGRELRQKKINVIGIVFPNISEPYLEKIVSSIKGYMDLHGSKYSLEITLTDNNPLKESDAILNYIGRNVSGIILYSCQPDNEKIFDSLEYSKIPYVLLDRRPEALDCNLVYMDNDSVFYQLTLHYLQAGFEDIAIVTGPKEYQENQYAIKGYEDALKSCGKPVREEYIISDTAIRECGFKAGINFCSFPQRIPKLILSTSYRLAEGIRYAYSLNHFDPKKDIKIITTGDSLHDVFFCDETIQKTARSAYEVGEKVCSLLLENIKSPVFFEKQQIVLQDNSGISSFSFPDHQELTQNRFEFKEKIKVLILDDENAVRGLSSLLVDFYEKTNIEVEFIKVLPENTFSFIVEYNKEGRDDIDVLLIDLPWLPYLAENNYFLCLNELEERYGVDKENYIPDILDKYGKYKGDLYAMPFMVSTQLLFYRRDLFKDEMYSRKFEEKCMASLKAPISWIQYNAVAEFFTRKYNPDSPTEFGHAMSLPYPEELICALMPRLWEYNTDLYNAQNMVQCDHKQVKKGVYGFLESIKYADGDTLRNRPIDALHKFSEGKVAMVSMYYNYATEIEDRLKSKVFDKFGYASIPGKPVLAGWSLALSRKTKKAESAFKFIQWASGSDIAVAHTILGGQSPNISVYQNYDMVSLYPWLPKSLYELGKAQKRKTPKDRNGDCIDEKLVENIIFENLRPYIENAIDGKVPSIKEVGEILKNIQLKILELY